MATALVIIDMQNGFCHSDGSAARLELGSVFGLDQLIPSLQTCISEFRGAECPILFTRHVYRHGYANAPTFYTNLLPPGADHCLAGTWDSEIIEQLHPRDSDFVIDKCRFDAFAGTDLHFLLPGLGVDHLVLGGILTNVCVETTARTAQQFDYAVTVLADGCASVSEADHERSLASLQFGIAKVASTSEAVAAL